MPSTPAYCRPCRPACNARRSTHRAPVLQRLAVMALGLWMVCGSLAARADTPPVANVIMGGAERRCSSYTGSGQSRDCTADWDTILAQDPAFAGLTRDDISFEADYPTPAFTYSLTQGHIDALRRIPARLFDPGRKSVLLAHLTQILRDSGPQEGLVWDALKVALPPWAVSSAEHLTAAQTAMLRSALVDRKPQGKRKVQARSIVFTANATSVASTAAFVSAARAANGGRTPLIGVVTASAGPHPFVDRDINVFSLRSAGADAVYVPLDGGFRQALDADDCGNLRYYYDSYTNSFPGRAIYHADLLFPDLAQQQQAFCEDHGQALDALLNRLNGVYFSGGNQARHLDSLVGKDAQGDYKVPSAQLKILQRRHALGQLVVAGTSAGDQFQGGGLWHGKPVPMVGGGDSYNALRRGFDKGQGQGSVSEASAPVPSEPRTSYAPVIYPQGGLGVFHFGVLDSHFSRRVREGRLVRATVDSAMDYGFGIDENTALVVSRADAAGVTHFSVLGAGGVFIADVRQAIASVAPLQPLRIDGMRAHYLLPGDTARIDAAGNLDVSLSAHVPVLPVAPTATLVTQDRVLDYGSSNFLNLATAMGRSGALLGYGTTQNSANPRNKQDAPYYSVTLSRDAHTVFRGALAEDEDEPAAVAYTGLRLQFAPCQGACQPPAPMVSHAP